MPDTQSLRSAFSRFATGVTVVTCLSETGPVAIVANSFSSLSLEPPLISWAVALKSQRAQAFLSAEHFAIHVLGADQKPILESVLEDGFALPALGAKPGTHDVPLLPDCLARLECRQAGQHEAGDHMLILGQVDTVVVTDGPALTFFSGAFQSLSPAG